MKPQNLFDQKIKAVIRSGIQQGDDQPHAFSAEYEQKKQEILQQAQRKSIRVTSRSKRRIGIAAIAVAVAAAIPTSVYAANLVRSTTRLERSGQYAADLVVQPQTEQSTTDSTQQLDRYLEWLIDYAGYYDYTVDSTGTVNMGGYEYKYIKTSGQNSDGTTEHEDTYFRQIDGKLMEISIEYTGDRQATIDQILSAIEQAR